jgi:hypothetical protein
MRACPPPSRGVASLEVVNTPRSLGGAVTRRPKARGRMPGGSTLRGCERECPEGTRSPGEQRAGTPSKDGASCNGLAPGSKALKPGSNRHLFDPRPRRRSSDGEAARRATVDSVRWPTARRHRTPRGVTAPDEGKALKGVELHERSRMKQGGAGSPGSKPSRGCETLRTDTRARTSQRTPSDPGAGPC